MDFRRCLSESPGILSKRARRHRVKLRTVLVVAPRQRHATVCRVSSDLRRKVRDRQLSHTAGNDSGHRRSDGSLVGPRRIYCSKSPKTLFPGQAANSGAPGNPASCRHDRFDDHRRRSSRLVEDEFQQLRPLRATSSNDHRELTRCGCRGQTLPVAQSAPRSCGLVRAGCCEDEQMQYPCSTPGALLQLADEHQRFFPRAAQRGVLPASVSLPEATRVADGQRTAPDCCQCGDP